MTNWKIRFHPALPRDLSALGTHELRIFHKKLKKLQANPERAKRLSGFRDCFREPITANFRIVYCLRRDELWLLAAASHDEAYQLLAERISSVDRSDGSNRHP